MSVTPRVTVIGNHISPFVRKVLAVCEIKGVPYRMDSIVPFFGNERFAELSPLRRIPVLIDGDVVLNDSSTICEYIDEKWPEHSVLPSTPADKAKARWLDEYADTYMSDVLLWKVFGRALVAPSVFKQPRDLEAIGRAIKEEVPIVMAYLEKQAPESAFLFGDTPGIADFSVASHFQNYRWGARQALDAERWPKAVAWVERVEQAVPMQQLNAIAEKVLRAPPGEHRPVLESFGVAMVTDSVGGPAPQRGPMTVL
jgi:glutathione S-transferase